MHLTYTLLPSELSLLLRSSMQTSSRGYQQLKKETWSTPGFQALLKYACFDMKPPLNFERIINSLGWLGLRDRLAAVYVYHRQYGHFPKTIDLKNIEDILNFEEKVKSFTIDGHSRSFLLAFYSTLCQEDSESGGSVQLDHPKLLPLLKKCTTRVIAIDWLILIILNSLEYLSEEKILESLMEDDPFNAIKRNLNANQIYQLGQNLLVYAASIGEDDIFVERL